MILQITDRCSMGCSHCMLDCKPEGVDMNINTLMDFSFFYSKLDPRTPIIISGGEPTEHPEFIMFVHLLEKISDSPLTLISNGSFLDNDFLLKEIIKSSMMVQITHDSRFYPKKINYKIAEKFGFKIDKKILMLALLGRASSKGFNPYDIPIRKNSSCLPLKRLFLRISKLRPSNLKELIQQLTYGINRFCIPEIRVNGDIVLGEYLHCQPIGTLTTPPDILFENIKNLKCNNCGLINDPNYVPMVNSDD